MMLKPESTEENGEDDFHDISLPAPSPVEFHDAPFVISDDENKKGEEETGDGLSSEEKTNASLEKTEL